MKGKNITRELIIFFLGTGALILAFMIIYWFYYGKNRVFSLDVKVQNGVKVHIPYIKVDDDAPLFPFILLMYPLNKEKDSGPKAFSSSTSYEGGHVLFNCRQSDRNTKLNYTCKVSSSSLNGEMSINGRNYNLTQGRVFIVCLTSENKAKVLQLTINESCLNPSDTNISKLMSIPQVKEFVKTNSNP